MDKIKITIQTTLALIVASTLVYIGSALIQIGNQIKSEGRISGGLVATSQENLGTTASSTIYTVSASTQQLLADTRQVRYFLSVCNDTSSTIFIAPTTTSANIPFENKGIPITTMNCYEFSQGKGNLYNGPVTLASSSANLAGNVYVLEKSR